LSTLQLAQDIYDYSHDGAVLHQEADEALELASMSRDQIEREKESMDSIKSAWFAEEDRHRQIRREEEVQIETLRQQRTSLQTEVAMERVAAEDAWRQAEHRAQDLMSKARADAEKTVQRARLAATKWGPAEGSWSSLGSGQRRSERGDEEVSARREGGDRHGSVREGDHEEGLSSFRRQETMRSPSSASYDARPSPLYSHYYHIWTYNPRFYSPLLGCSSLPSHPVEGDVVELCRAAPPGGPDHRG